MLLRREVWIPRMRERGYPTVTAQAEAVGCFRTHLSEMLSGKVGPGQAMARKLTEAADLPPAYLFKLTST